jgi:hypothetical protein
MKLFDELKLRNLKAGGPGSGRRPGDDVDDNQIPFTEELRHQPTTEPVEKPTDDPIPFTEEIDKKRMK